MGAGKTTIANLLTVSHGYRRIAHADAMKDLAALAYGPIDKGEKYRLVRMSANNLPYIEERSGREVLQMLGQGVKQTVDRDFWLNVTRNRVTRSPDPVVNDDTRFLFEADGLREMGFTMVRVETPDHIRMQRLTVLYGRAPDEQELMHESEQEITEIRCDYSISGVLEPWAAVQQLVHDLGLDSPDKMRLMRRA